MSLLKEPFVHFLLLGGVLFSLHAFLTPKAQDNAVIDVSQDLIDSMRRQHEKKYGKAPTVAQLDALIQQYVDDEILFREALALGLERGDPVVRRRLVQQIAWVAESGSTAKEPSNDELASWLKRYPKRYERPGRLSFDHVFFSRDKPKMGERAQALIEGKPGPGDPFALGHTLRAQTPGKLSQVFGAEFSNAVQSLALNTWSDPISSSYGLHRVRVTHKTKAQPATLKQVKKTIIRDIYAERRQKARQSMLDRLKARYTVERP